jgi:hypothetical protein
MADNNEARNQGMPTPDLALKRLNRLLGTWSMKGHPIGSITGTTTFKWLQKEDDDGTGVFPAAAWIQITQVNQSRVTNL